MAAVLARGVWCGPASTSRRASRDRVVPAAVASPSREARASSRAWGSAFGTARARARSAAARAYSADPPSPPPRSRPRLAPAESSRDLPIKVMVECAMLSALTALLFHLSTLFRMDAYFGAVFPMPVVIAAARHGNKAAARVAQVTTLLLFIVSGPLRCANYIFLHGAMGFSLGVMWNARKSWFFTVPVSALVRSAGIFCSLMLSSLILRENVMQLLVTQMYGLLDQIAANVGATFMPSIGWVWGIAFFFVLLNSLSYVGILHAVYAIILRAISGIQSDYVNAPDRVKKFLGVPPYGPGGSR